MLSPAAARKQLPVAHPENTDIHDIIITLFAGPFRGAGQPSRNTVVVTPGHLDRSPCGTGTTARLAVLRARGLLEVGDTLPHDSILDTRFLGTIVADTLVAGRPAVVTTISGRAWLTGIHQYGLDPADPFPEGYTLSDTWLV